jgi:hypothetical protein
MPPAVVSVWHSMRGMEGLSQRDKYLLASWLLDEAIPTHAQRNALDREAARCFERLLQAIRENE